VAAHVTTMSRPAVSQHLGVLRGAGLVTERRDGNRRLYRADPRSLDPVRHYLDRFWSSHLTGLKHAVEHDLTTKEHP
jgi:DNA-binding transcriptional ArsR family regulator